MLVSDAYDVPAHDQEGRVRATHDCAMCDAELLRYTRHYLTSDVTHIAQSCVTRHSGDVRNMFPE